MSKKSKIEIIKKIKKLMAHERSARMMGNIGEADNFRAKIEELRAAHSITQEIKLDAETEADAFIDYGGEPVFRPDSKLFRKHRVFWEEALFANLCAYFECRPIVYKENNLKVVVGEKEKRAKVIKSYLHLHRTALKEFSEFIRPRRAGLTFEARGLRRKSFLFGFGFVLQQRLEHFKSAEIELAWLEKVSGIRPARIEGQTGALVKKESIAVSEKRAAIDREIDELPKTQEEPFDVEIEEESFFAGINAGMVCPISDDVALPARQAFDDLNEVRERLERRQRRTSIFENVRAAVEKKSVEFPRQSSFAFVFETD